MGEGHVPLPLPYAPDSLKKFRPSLVLSWTMEGPKVPSEGESWEARSAGAPTG